MRVTMLVRCLGMMRGGGEVRHLEWARELTSMGVETDIISGRPLLLGGPRYPAFDDEGGDGPGPRLTLLRTPYTRDFVYRHQRRRFFGRLTMTALHADEEWFCRAAWKHLGAAPRKPDVVHAHALHQAARLRVGSVPVVINLPGAPNPRYLDDLQRADALVADGWAADHLPETIGRPIDRVSKGVDADRFHPDGPTRREELGLNGKRVIITVARLVPIKNVRLLVEAFVRVRARVADAHLLIVGEGPECAALRAGVAARGLAGSVTMTGFVPRAELPPFYRTANVFALSSDFDNSPNAVLEAMASGLAVVATDAGGVRDFVGAPAGGALVRPGDHAELARALEGYLTQPDAARVAGRHNRDKAVACTWRASAQQLLDVYRRVIDARQAGARTPA